MNCLAGLNHYTCACLTITDHVFMAYPSMGWRGEICQAKSLNGTVCGLYEIDHSHATDLAEKEREWDLYTYNE